MTKEDRDVDVYVLHGEIATLFHEMKDRVFKLKDKGVDTKQLLIGLSFLAEHLANMAQSERERIERRVEVENLLSELRRNNDERKKG